MPKLKSGMLLVPALLLLIALTPAPKTMIPAIPNAHAASVTFTLFAYASGGWNATTNPNPTITVNQGDTVTIVLKPGDGLTHEWFLDVDKNGPTPDCPGADICSQLFNTQSPPPVTFTAPAAGTYTYYCSVHPPTRTSPSSGDGDRFDGSWADETQKPSPRGLAEPASPDQGRSNNPSRGQNGKE